MVRIEKLAQVAAMSVTGQRVLSQVVGAHGKEVHQPGQLRRHEHGGGSLNHDADLGVRVEGDPFGGELIHHPLAGPAALLHLPHAGDHGEHDGDLTAGAGPVQRPQLGAEHLGMVETDADGPQAQGWVLLPVQMETAACLSAPMSKVRTMTRLPFMAKATRL